ncbi:MAG TPA: dephospho-CoA kinase [Candidatus Tidjanibacter gallistercoris]|nr:dephospho-CoA kinase [Candidatus Tidjanibacter gallistercoris]
MNARIPFKVGITGGIGSGKSIVCRMFVLLGVPVYDSDAEARRLMSSDPALAEAIRERFGTASYRGGVPDRKYLAAQVFGNPSALAALNGMVHPAVTADFRRWAAGCTADYVLVESAVLFESGLNREVDAVVTVSAPEELRAARAAARDHASAEEIRARMRSQMDDAGREALADYVVVNDGRHLLWEQVLRLDEIFRHGRP